MRSPHNELCLSRVSLTGCSLPCMQLRTCVGARGCGYKCGLVWVHSIGLAGCSLPQMQAPVCGCEWVWIRAREWVGVRVQASGCAVSECLAKHETGECS
eukprot:365436-Chlamydomonas_euryale.AAC.6